LITKVPYQFLNCHFVVTLFVMFTELVGIDNIDTDKKKL
jgi:hypothetical protein